MTDDRTKDLDGEVLEHLKLFRQLGIRWAARPPRSAARNAAASEKAPQGGQQPAAARSLRGGASRSVPSPRVAGPAPLPARLHVGAGSSMFDALPVPAESLDKVRADLGDCRRCKLAPLRTNLVFGSGDPHAQLMFVGEAPGADEDEQGLPFVGRAGQLLTRIIESIEMKRPEVYICNILKCRPPGNRNPESDEIASCEPFLLRQVAAIRPRVICALGTYSAQTLLRTKEPIGRLRGNFFDYHGSKLIATFHPAYLLRNPGEKRKVWEDVQRIRDFLKSS